MTSVLKAALRRVLPGFVRRSLDRRLERRRLAQRARANAERSPAEVFGEIYTARLWGGEPDTFYSGTGSTGPASDRYIALVNDFIRTWGIRSVVDIGCGDYRIGSRLEVGLYTGVDVAAPVIASNKERFGSATRAFVCLDAAEAEHLPAAELCLVRQVFQHLSNRQVASMLTRLRQYPFVIVTEHHPADADFRSCNRDIVHGQDTRLSFGSGVFLDRPPFDETVRLLLECTDEAGGGIYQRGPIRTFLLGPPPRFAPERSGPRE